MHKCKTTTHATCNIDRKTYQKLQEQIAQGSFLNAMKIAANQVTQNDSQIEKQVYQEEFSLPMRRNMFGLLSIPVYINHVKCNFLVDTGAQISGVREKMSECLAIKKAKGSLVIGSIGGTQKTMQGLLVEQLQLGALEYHQVPMVCLSDKDFTLRFGNIDLFGFDGIIGWDILSQLDFEMDDISKEFKVLKNRFRFDYPNMIQGSFPVFLVKRRDESIAVYGFDSGSKVSWIGEEAITKYQLDVLSEGSTLGFGVHGIEKMSMKLVNQEILFLDRAKITLQETMTGRTKLFESFTFDGVLGNEIFRGRRIRLLNSKSMILLV